MVAAAVQPMRPRIVYQDYRLVGGNRDFFRSREPECLVEGAAGTGKTLAACLKLHAAALRYPNARLLMVRKTLEALKAGALSTYLTAVRPQSAGVVFFGGNKVYPAEFRYPNGAVILVTGMDKAEKILSSQFDMIFVNEGTELTEDDWQTLKTRIRNAKMPYQQLLADCNPASPRHWLNLRCNAGLTRRIVSTHRDNPAYWRNGDWTPLGRQYVEQTLGSLSGVARKRLLDGVWAAVEGLVYDQFEPSVHVKTVDVTGWRTILGVDIGSRNPTAILDIHASGDERVHVSHEIYRRNMTSDEITDAIAERMDVSGADEAVIDPSAKGYIESLQRRGYRVEAANNDVLRGIQTVQSLLVRPGGFSIDPSCVETIGEFGLYAYPSGQRAQTDKPIKDNDHAMDSIRYGVLRLIGGVSGAIEPVPAQTAAALRDWYEQP